MGCGFDNIVMSDCLHMKGADVGTNLERLKAAQDAGNDFLMYTHQHGKALDELPSIIDKIPDSKEASERRERLANALARSSQQQKRLLLSYTAQSSVAQTVKSEITDNKEEKENSEETNTGKKKTPYSVLNS